MNAKSMVSLVGKRFERLDTGRDAELDAVVDAGFGPVLAGGRGPLLGDVAAEQVPVGREAPGDAQRRVAGEGADLDRVLRPRSAA